jgi:hypothetical protein
MAPIYKRGQLPKVLIFWGLFLLVIFCAFLATGKFEMRSGSIHGGRTSRVISRQDSPMIYWGTESSILALALLLCVMGVYRAREDTDDTDA